MRPGREPLATSLPTLERAPKKWEVRALRAAGEKKESGWRAERGPERPKGSKAKATAAEGPRRAARRAPKQPAQPLPRDNDAH